MRLGKPQHSRAILAAVASISAALLFTPASAIASPQVRSAPASSSAEATATTYDWKNATVAPTKAQLQQGIDDVLARTPGARQLNATSVEMAPGLVMNFRNPVPDGARQADSPITTQATCNITTVCVYTNRQYGGDELVFSVCGREWNLGNVAYPGGGYWNDRISSITNQQTGSGATSYFYDYRGSNVWNRIVTVAIGNYRSNLALDTREDGLSGSPNDKIDGVHVCGAVPSPWRPNWP
ncbi:hypothetical protein ACLQ2S_24505 [Micromonospora sp. DT48]|uniref:hypothetical protein n=1 Tax=Micromonospora sp. DT48 TaxID=3393429 RepID=UPI003CF0E17D